MGIALNIAEALVFISEISAYPWFQRSS